MRVPIDFPDKYIIPFAELCKRENISRSEAIRRAITIYIAEHTAKKAYIDKDFSIPGQ